MPGCERFLCLFVPNSDFVGSKLAVTVNGVVVRLQQAPVLQAYSIFDVQECVGRDEDTTTQDIIIDLRSHKENAFIYRRIDNHLVRAEIAICRHSSAAVGSSFDRIKKIGHRGCGMNRYSPLFAENTIDSFLEARKRGAHAVELDVHLTSDNVPVVHHDESIGGVLIRDMAYSGFLVAVGNEEERTCGPTSLGLVLKALPDDLGVNIELKRSAPQHLLTASDDYVARLAAAVMVCVQEHKTRTFLFSSFSSAACVYLRLLNSTSNVHYLVPDTVMSLGSEESMILQIMEFARGVNINGFCLSTDIVSQSQGFRKIIADGEFSCYCYGEATNDREKAQELILLGVKGLITDDLFGIQDMF